MVKVSIKSMGFALPWDVMSTLVEEESPVFPNTLFSRDEMSTFTNSNR